MEQYACDVSVTVPMVVQMNEEHVIEDLDIGSRSVDRRPTLDHHPIYHLTIYPWYRTTCSWVFCDGVSLTVELEQCFIAFGAA